MSLPNIGKIFKRDNSTVMSSIDIIEKKINTDNSVASDIDEIKKDVENGKV